MSLRGLKRWAGGVLIGVDQLFNAIVGGFPDETFSSRMGVRRRQGDSGAKAACVVLDAIQQNHCGMSIEEDADGAFESHHGGKLIHEIPRDPATRLRKAGLVVALALFSVSCRDIKLPPCLTDGTLCQPSPAPASPSPSTPPTTLPAPPSPDPTPTPMPTPRPTPIPTPSPCVQASPSSTCARPHDPSITPGDCWACGELRGWQVAQGNWIDHHRPDGWLEDNVGSGRFVTKDCDVVRNDGTLVHLREDGYLGNVCPRLDAPCPVASPRPCPVPTSSPAPEGTPQPGPTPATCPTLVRWGGGLHAQMNPQHQGLPKTPTFAGNTIDFDSTARFGSGRGQPCNDEHHEVCSVDGTNNSPWRHCEDPRGPIWSIVNCGGRESKTINDGWGFRIVDVFAGTCIVRICPRADVHDAEGQRVNVGPNACTDTPPVEVQ